MNERSFMMRLNASVENSKKKKTRDFPRNAVESTLEKVMLIDSFKKNALNINYLSQAHPTMETSFRLSIETPFRYCKDSFRLSL